MKEKAVHNNIHVKFKKTKVKDHHMISSFSNKTKFITACNNKLKSRTLNVNVVCATFEKCVFNSNHDAGGSKFINDMNARTKKPKVVPISTRKPKSQANKSIATPYKKAVVSNSTIIVQLILFIIDSGCTKHMTGNLKLMCNLIEKYLGKEKRRTFKTKTIPSSKGRLNFLHIDLCGPMRIESINGKKYILVIVDDYSRYTWTHFLRTKDETPEVHKDFLKMIQCNLQAQVITVRTDRGT
ncbi:retrovirus-related pol polyprotein from transposon TNT 1-94 [Tanacetum coccineum]